MNQNFDPLKRRVYAYDTPMRQALERTHTVYPPDRNFAVSGAIGNEKQYSENLEWK